MKLTFKERQLINKFLYEIFPNQKHYELDFYVNCFKLLPPDVRVVELGGYQGELAYDVLKLRPNLEWLNIEITEHNVIPYLKNYRYKEHILSKQIWEEKPNINGYDVFICSDTLEHFNNNDAIKILEFIGDSQVQYLMLKIPVEDEGSGWHDDTSSHALTMGKKELRNHITSLGFEIIIETGNWCSFWGRNHIVHPN